MGVGSSSGSGVFHKVLIMGVAPSPFRPELGPTEPNRLLGDGSVGEGALSVFR